MTFLNLEKRDKEDLDPGIHQNLQINTITIIQKNRASSQAFNQF